MRLTIITCLLACSLVTTAQAQYVPAQPPSMDGVDAATIGQPVPPPQQGMTLSQKCALASQYLKSGNCGPEGCDAALCVALQHGCHINSWGYRCRWNGQ